MDRERAEEQIQMIREYNEALRQERDTLRAEVSELKAKWKREECAHCDERPSGHEGTIWCAECFNWHCSEADKEYREQLQAELDTLRAEAARLREALEVGIKSAHPHPTEHPTMTAAWKVMADALSSTPSTAEWLAERDAEMKRLGAAEWLEKAAWKARRDMGELYERSVDGMLEEAAAIREGKDA